MTLRKDAFDWSNHRWLEEGEQNIALGIVNFIFGVVCISLYIPCCIVLLHKDLRRLAAYKLLAIITFCEIYGLFLNSILSGIFFVKGVVFCNYPNLIYVLGCGSLLTWTGTCCSCCFLSFSRLVDLWSSKWHDKIFSGKRFIFVFLAILFYMMSFFFFANPIVFNSKELAWVFDPLVYPDGSHNMDYINFMTVLNNEVMVTVTLIVNMTFIISFCLKSTFYKFRLTTLQKQMFLQSAFASVNAFVDATIFISYLFIDGGRLWNYLGLVFWQIATAGDLVLFLFVNATVSRRVLNIYREIYHLFF